MNRLFILFCLALVAAYLINDNRQRGGFLSDAPLENITEENFQEVVLSNDLPVLVDFSASWCGPCREMEPILASLAVEFEGRVVVGKVDFDENRALAQRYNITMIPAMILFKNGQVIDGILGSTNQQTLAAKLNQAAGEAR